MRRIIALVLCLFGLSVPVFSQCTITQPGNVSACVGQQVSIPLSGSPGLTFFWTNNNPAIGLAASGTGNIQFTAANNSALECSIATITVTASGNGCSIPPYSFQVKVCRSGMTTPTNLEVCNGAGITPPPFSSSNPGTTYSWTNDNPSIGLPASGSGNLPPFVGFNPGFANVVALITVTPTSGAGCAGAPVTMNIVVKPTPAVAAISDQTVCSGSPTSPVVLTGPAPFTSFSWSNNNISIGLPPSGTGDISAFVANTGTTPSTSTVTVTPTAKGCTGPLRTFTYTVLPVPKLDTLINETICAGTTYPGRTMTSNIPNTTTTWFNSNTSIGLTPTGMGNIPPFLAVNNGSGNITATFTVVPSAGGCIGQTRTFVLTVKPTPHLQQLPAPQVVCAGTLTSPVVFAGTLSGTTFSWSHNGTGIGIAATGTGNIPAFGAINNSANPVLVTFTVIPTANGCTGPTITFTITIKPKPRITAPLWTQLTVCEGATLGANNVFSFVTNPANASLSWTNDNSAIGLPLLGTGGISFVTDNPTNLQITGRIVVTPELDGCTGPSRTYAVSVDPMPAFDAPSLSNYVYCPGDIVPPLGFALTPSNATFVWSRTNAAIGLVPVNGTGTIPGYTASNSGTTPLVSTFSIAPRFGTCTAPARTFTVTVNPRPQLTGPLSPVVLCGYASGMTNTPFPTLTSTIPNANPSLGYTWTNDNTAIGLPLTGSGQWNLFTPAAGPASAMVMATPVYTNVITCMGTPVPINITIKPRPVIAGLSNRAGCTGTTFAAQVLSTQPPGGAITWQSTGLLGLPTSGSGNVPPLNALNPGSVPLVGGVTALATLDGCTGPTASASYTIYPRPIAQLTGGSFCRQTGSTQLVVSGTQGGVFSSTPGLVISPSGLIDLTNSASGIYTVRYTVGNGFGCTITVTAIVSVYDTPVMTATPLDQTVCAGTSTAAVLFSSNVPGTVFTWSYIGPNIGIAANGMGNLPAFTAVNNSTNPVTASFTVIPVANGCSGTPVTFSITVKPTPQIVAPANLVLTVCEGTMINPGNFNVQTYPPGSMIEWLNSNPAIGLPPVGAGPIAFTTQNGVSEQISATIQIRAVLNGCTGPYRTYTIRVDPMPELVGPNPSNLFYCPGDVAPALTFSFNPAMTRFTWSRTSAAIGLPPLGATLVTQIPGFTASNSGTTSLVSDFTLSPRFGTCTAPNLNFSITVNPQPQLTAPLGPVVLCGFASGVTNQTFPTLASTVAAADPHLGYMWTNDNTGIGLPSGGNGQWSAYLPGAGPAAGTVLVTPVYDNGIVCAGLSVPVTVTIKPRPVVTGLSDQSWCAGTLVTVQPLGTSPAGGTINWQSFPDIGLPVSGSGDLPSFVATNPGTVPISSILTAQPTLDGCGGPAASAVFTVNPLPEATISGGTFCMGGGNVQLAVTGATGGAFSAGAGLEISSSGLINLNNSAPGSYTVSYTVTNAQGCMRTVTSNVVVGSFQPATISGGSFCASGSATLMVISGAADGSFSSEPGLVLSPAGVIDAGASSPGTYTVTYSFGAGGCPGTTTSTVTINPVPAVDPVASQTICSGNDFAPIQFTGTPGATFHWSSSGAPIAPGATGVGYIAAFTDVNAGTSNAVSNLQVYASLDGCNSDPVSFTLTVRPTPVLSLSYPAAFYCLPNPILTMVNPAVAYPVVTGGSGGIFSYTPATPNFNLNATTGALTMAGTDAGMYSITYTIPESGGNCAAIATTTVDLRPSPYMNSYGNQMYCPGYLVAPPPFTSTPGGATYVWTNDNVGTGLPANGTGDLPPFTTQVSAGNPGPYESSTIHVTPTLNGCTGRTIGMYVRVKVSGTACATTRRKTEQGAAGERPALTVAPNPVDGVVSVTSPFASGVVELRLYDSRGVLVRRRRSAASPRLSWDLGGVARGTYFLELRHESGEHYVTTVYKL